MINVKLFLEIREAVLAEPYRVDMDSPFYVNGCKSAGCIAGWACVLAAKAHRMTQFDELNSTLSRFFQSPTYFHSRYGAGEWFELDWRRIRSKAIELLGLEDFEPLLFNFHACAQELYLDLYQRISAPDMVEGSPEYAAIVVEAIDRFLNSKGFDVSTLLREQKLESVLA